MCGIYICSYEIGYIGIFCTVILFQRLFHGALKYAIAYSCKIYSVCIFTGLRPIGSVGIAPGARRSYW